MKRVRLAPADIARTCIITGKRQFTQAAAAAELAHVKCKPGHHERRVYRCPMCNHYHLTSKAEWR